MLFLIVELHVDAVKSSLVYTVNIDALIHIESSLFQIKGKAVMKNSVYLLRLEREVGDQPVFRIVADELRLEELGDTELIKRHV